MNDGDRSRFAQALLLMAEVFNESISEARAEGYFESLRDLSITSIENAVKSAMKTEKFFPKPVELRQKAAPHLEGQLTYGWSRLIQEFDRAKSLGVRPMLYDLEPVVVAVWGSWEKCVAAIEASGRFAWEQPFKLALTANIQARDEAITRKQLNA